ncbi:class I SAM-dependent methyltransferase [Streptomyces justiciae]|uniref:class I SAM-dependent methyltransferase n=1 Tax=Streptomyces justiciae TaxID=2780140 RepID=UPI00211951BA|nr:methyltransferase domain-containing protein [Streptomyces justiciae]MCW8382226.1 methyltransferase domain-containing protein [Streptomyces justiciae]
MAAVSITTEFLKRPLMTGAVTASSRRLARAMTQHIGLGQARLVVELGPGTGVFTDAVLRRLAPDARLVAIELNPDLAERLAATRDDKRLTVVHGAAAELADVAGGPVDAVVSGLPWTVMPTADRNRTLDAVAAALAPSGRFTTFAYLHAAWTPPGRHLAAGLRERFGTVDRSPVVWPNLPPAFVHRARAPKNLRMHRHDGSGPPA